MSMRNTRVLVTGRQGGQEAATQTHHASDSFILQDTFVALLAAVAASSKSRTLRNNPANQHTCTSHAHAQGSGAHAIP